MSRLRAFIAAQPLLAPLIAGVVARLVTAVVSIGFFGRDDYFHVLEPALRWLADPGFVWEGSGATGDGLRSHLVPRLVQGLLALAHAVGFDSPETRLRLVYAAFGLYSASTIVAVHLVGRRLLSERATLIATWLAALHFAMPFLGTRLLLEAVAMPPLVFGIYLATFTTTARLFGAGVLVGLACAVRYQVASAALGLAIVVGLRDRDRLVRSMAALVAGAALALSAQGLFDALTAGGFLRPTWNNLVHNLSPPEALSRSSPLTYLGLLVLLTAPPATLVLLPALLRAGRQLPLVSLPLVSFVLVHSLVPHKEERFLAPVLPLLLLLIGAAPDALAGAVGPSWGRLRRYAPLATRYFVVVHAVLLAVTLTSQPQQNLREVMQRLREDEQARAVVSLGPELQLYFLGERRLPASYAPLRDPAALERVLGELARRGTPANRFVSSSVERDSAAILLSAHGLSCDEPEELSGAWLDRLVFALNPRRNKRRAPVLLWRCEQPALAYRSRGL